jgi:hypothetical protein
LAGAGRGVGAPNSGAGRDTLSNPAGVVAGGGISGGASIWPVAAFKLELMIEAPGLAPGVRRRGK